MSSSKKAMNIFTSRIERQSNTNTLDWPEEILRNIALGGTATKTVEPIIGGNLNKVLNLSSGSPRIQTNVANKFNLIIEQPKEISILNPFEIRCCLCRSVIRYPVWYYSIKYAVNHFHYFICFDSSSPDKPSTKCYRRG